MNIERIKNVKAESNGFVELASNLKAIGITHFHADAKTASVTYFGNGETVEEKGPFNFSIGEDVDVDTFVKSLKAHQRGEMDFPTWLEKTTSSGISSWEVRLLEKTCTYFDRAGALIYVEAIPMEG